MGSFKAARCGVTNLCLQWLCVILCSLEDAFSFWAVKKKKRVVQLIIDGRLYFMKYVVSLFLLPQWVVVTMDDRDGLVQSVCSEKLLHYHVS